MIFKRRSNRSQKSQKPSAMPPLFTGPAAPAPARPAAAPSQHPAPKEQPAPIPKEPADSLKFPTPAPAPAAAPATPTPGESSGGGGGGLRILLIDDSRTMRNIQRNILGQLGYKDIDEAGDGQEALAKVESFNPDIILVDWNMPKMDGITFVKKFRASGKQTPIVMVTTEAEKARVVEAIKAGVNNYVVKPFTAESLSARIKETVAKRKAA